MAPSQRVALNARGGHARTGEAQPFYDLRVAHPVRLTVVSSQAEADIVCSLLRANGIACADRPADISGEVMGFGSWTEVLVAEADVPAAQELLEATPPE
jgi:hypothetical protein